MTPLNERPEESRKPSEEYKFFLLDPLGDGMSYYRSKAFRDEQAKIAIQQYLDPADGWNEEVSHILVGELTGKPEPTNITKPIGEIDEEGCDESGEYWGSQFTTKCDYEIAHWTSSIQSVWNMLNDCIVGKQSAWIEWKHGKGCEAAMGWIENSLSGPGLIPDETEEYATNAQFWYDTNNSDPFPKCFCGNPSRMLWMGKGACCQQHMKQIKAEAVK